VDRATSGLRFKLPVARALPPMTQGTPPYHGSGELPGGPDVRPDEVLVGSSGHDGRVVGSAVWIWRSTS
jgi:hypothetical protein